MYLSVNPDPSIIGNPATKDLWAEVEILALSGRRAGGRGGSGGGGDGVYLSGGAAGAAAAKQTGLLLDYCNL